MPVVLRWKILDELANKVPVISQRDFLKENLILPLMLFLKSKKVSIITKLLVIQSMDWHLPQTAKDAIGYFR